MSLFETRWAMFVCQIVLLRLRNDIPRPRLAVPCPGRLGSQSGQTKLGTCDSTVGRRTDLLSGGQDIRIELVVVA